MANELTPLNNPVALIAGPTASGKSAVAVALAKHLAEAGRTGIVINADSAQVYADLAVLSARPTKKEMDGIDHRLFGAWDGKEACSAANWAKAAREEIALCHEQGAVPILVGGTGLYLKVLLEGIAPIPAIDPEVREIVRAMEAPAAYAALQIEDPLRAAELEPGDSQRIARALEVKRSTGVTLGDWQLAKSGGIAEQITLYPLLLLPPREWVYRRCDARFEAMLEGGALSEVEALLERDLDPDLPVMRAIGVPEISALLEGEATREEAAARAAQATRNYAKRQFTWFRRQTGPDWPRIETEIELKNIEWDRYFAGLFQT